jgi:hypothetical protein
MRNEFYPGKLGNFKRCRQEFVILRILFEFEIAFVSTLNLGIVWFLNLGIYLDLGSCSPAGRQGS